jgi:adenosylcobyric acid synthase
MGRTSRAVGAAPALSLGSAGAEHPDGCASADGRVWGCYLHGIFANADFRRAWLSSLGWRAGAAAPTVDPYDRLADIVESRLNPDQLSVLLDSGFGIQDSGFRI